MIRYSRVAAALASLSLLAACGDDGGGREHYGSVATQLSADDGDDDLDTEAADCAKSVIHVSADAKPGGNGDKKRPLADLRTAMAVAAKLSTCRVVIDLAPGTYFDSQQQQPQQPIVIPRSIDLHGNGATLVGVGLVMTGAFSLRIADTRFAKVEGVALYVKNKGAAVTLRRVAVGGVTGYGMIQRGGTLSAKNVTFEGVAASSPDKPSTSGFAILLADGLLGELRHILLRDSVGGVYVWGETTNVSMWDLDVSSIGPHPALARRIHDLGPDAAVAGFRVAAVEAAAGAELHLQHSRIDHSAISGLAARDRAQIIGDDVVVSDSYAVFEDPLPAMSPQAVGGFGVVANNDGHVLLDHFKSLDSDLCGIMLSGGTTTSMDLHVGVISHAPIGACVALDGYDTERLHDRVDYRDVGIPLQATSYHLPDGLDDSDP